MRIAGERVQEPRDTRGALISKDAEEMMLEIGSNVERRGAVADRSQRELDFGLTVAHAAVGLSRERSPDTARGRTTESHDFGSIHRFNQKASLWSRHENHTVRYARDSGRHQDEPLCHQLLLSLRHQSCRRQKGNGDGERTSCAAVAITRLL
jgi:hypothetical protein